MDSVDPKERRRLRKQILDKRKTNMFKHLPISVDYVNDTVVQHDTENSNPQLLLKYQQTIPRYSANFTNTSYVDNDAKQRRKQRKMVLDARRLISMYKTPNENQIIHIQIETVMSFVPNCLYNLHPIVLKELRYPTSPTV
ncbi:hypothetical protein LXL04_033477 [Taraxacum kok-saghyz]